LPISLASIRPLSLTAAAAVLAVGISGCTGATPNAPSSLPPLPGVPSSTTTSTTTPSTTPQAAAPDYGRLLLTAGDLTDADDTFTRRSETPNPNGSTGASAFFVNDKDNRAITDTVLVYPDAAAATATLQKTTASLPTLVTGGTPKPVPVGADGTMISGTYPDQNKAVTLLFFAQDRAVVRLEFQSAPGDATTDKFVTGVAKMQQIALRVGLPAPQ
jgi:hypothetical protein